MDIIIEAKGLKKTFEKDKKGKVEVIRGVDLNVVRGEYLCIMGPSGVGKTTLLYILSSLDKPDEGSVLYFINGTSFEIFNKTNDELARLRNQKIGFIFQFHHLLPEFTAIENVALPAIIGGVKEKVAFTKAKQLLIDLGLEGQINNKPSELSGGEQQRVAIARALINNPEIVFADEPTGNLDTNTARTVLNLMASFQKKLGITFIVATHSNEVANYGDRIAFMKDGKIVEIRGRA
ncbi:MAG: Lipoprotein-releasing system ATP-binding protein LolD [Candidatus Kapaibacterium sp.]|nr:MAG: Lipoprotein-releasing system ATP-binding protein LolD [Candidatus Kapabacteria bacterium]